MRVSRILFWIFFPLSFAIISALLIFLYDLTNGPLIFFILQLFALVAFLVVRILLRNKKFYFRIIPWGALILTTALLLPLSHPATAAYPAVSHVNPKKTGELLLRDGLVQGVYSADEKVEVYAGIPYAKPPVGEYRWKAPVDPEPWQGVRDCSYFAAKSMQPGSNPITDTLVDIYSEQAWHPDYHSYPLQNKSEDSLYLNIWRPATNQTNLPVLFFIHGGSLTTGSSAFEDYNGESMAHQGVIMITFGYRLGVFGYFAHQELIDEDTEHHSTGNYGLLDQIKALEWVKENASYFGGDPNNVTIAGESAGSSAVSALCASPLAAGLFRRAIGESSSVVVSTPPHTFRSKEAALKTGEAIMKEMGAKNIAELRNVPAERLVETAHSNSSMMVDGYALPKAPCQVYEEGNSNEEALLNGYNVKEADAFVVPQYLFSPTNKDNIRERLVSVFGETIAAKIVDLYADFIAKDAFTAFNEIISVYWFIHPHHQWTKMALSSGKKVYRYQFTKENGYHSTYHAGEMVYAYGNVEKARRHYAYNESDYALARTMNSYWANFAKTGDPNGEGLPRWEEYENLGDEVQELGAHVGPFADRYKDLYPLIDEFLASAQN